MRQQSTTKTTTTLLKIKALSQNRAWFGRRFKTAAYKDFEQSCNWLLPRSMYIPTGKLEINYIFGLSNKGMDVDAGIKCLTDILSHKYDFNDNRVYKLTAEKVVVPKGEEFIEFTILPYEVDLTLKAAQASL